MAAPSPTTRKNAWVLGTLGTGHGVSHFHLLALPPLFPLIKAEFEVGYAELGLLITVLNLATGIAQVPAGFLADRFGARLLLVLGLALMGTAMGLIGLSVSYGMMLALVALAGVGNSVVHPCDYVIMSASIASNFLARAFSIHTFAGNVGFTLAPVTMIALAALAGWRAALMLAALLAVGAVVLILLAGERLADHRRPPATDPKVAPAAPGRDRRLLLSAPILLMLLFYVFTAMVTSGIHSFSVAALVDVQGVELGIANTVLTAFLLTSSAGILLGGLVADRTRRYALLTTVTFGAAGLLLAVVGLVAMPALALILLFGVAGLLQGLVRPARDMMVRAVTPAAATGKVFAFVMTGLNVGAALSPVLFGLILDVGNPRLVFWLPAVFFTLAILVILAVEQLARHQAPTQQGEVVAG